VADEYCSDKMVLGGIQNNYMEVNGGVSYHGSQSGGCLLCGLTGAPSALRSEEIHPLLLQ
jgi:hypothetical protein